MPDPEFKKDVQDALVELLKDRNTLAAVLTEVQFMPVPSLAVPTDIPGVPGERAYRYPRCPTCPCPNPCIPAEGILNQDVEDQLVGKDRDQIIYQALSALFEDSNMRQLLGEKVMAILNAP